MNMFPNNLNEQYDEDLLSALEPESEVRQIRRITPRASLRRPPLRKPPTVPARARIHARGCSCAHCRRGGKHAAGCVCNGCTRARVVVGRYLDTSAPIDYTGPIGDSERVRWVQSVLNRVLGLRLPIDGVLSAALRSAVRDFQRREGLPADGIIGPPTEQALARATGASEPTTAQNGTASPEDGAPPQDSGEELFLDELWSEASSAELFTQSETIETAESFEIAPSPRGGREHTRWIQTSLNRILGLRLAEDGVAGTATRSAVRTFQQRQGLAADGVVGARTEAAIVAALTASPTPNARAKQPCEILRGFDFDRDDLKLQHQQQINAIAHKISTGKVVSVQVTGHTDPVGTNTYNIGLGQRRADRAVAALRQALDKIKPGLGSSTKITADSRGESEPIRGDAPGSRRVEICTTFSAVRPPKPKGCAPQKARIRLHIKILDLPKVPIARMVRRMREVYGPSGFRVEIASTEQLRLPTLTDLDVGGCTLGSTTAEQRALFANRNNVRQHDVVVYFVRTTNPPFNGCASHPNGRPGAVVARGATEWTMAHEVGHVLGLSHVNNNDRLMTGNGTANITNPPPDLNATEIKTMDASSLTIDC